MSQRLRWVLDIDIVKYFDPIPHSHLRDFLDQRVTDGVISAGKEVLLVHSFQHHDDALCANLSSNYVDEVGHHR